jgi:signal transduction histidine kinase
LRALTTSAVRLTSLLDLDHVLTTVVEMLAQEFDAALARVWLHDAGDNSFRMSARAGEASDPAEGMGQIPFSEMTGWVSEVVQRQRPVVITNPAATEGFVREWIESEAIATAAAFPLGSGGELDGILVYYSRRSLPAGAIDVLTAFSALITTSLHDIRRLSGEQAARAEAEEANSRLQAVQDIMDAAFEDRPLDKLVIAIMDRIRTALHADTGTMLLLDADEKNLRVAASLGLREEETQRVTIPVGRGFAGRIAATSEPLIVENSADVNPVSPWLRNEIKSVMGVPLIVEGKTAGVMHVGSRTRRRFTEKDLVLLQLVAHRVVTFMERSRLRQAEREAHQEAEAARARSTFLAEASRVLSSSLVYRTTLSNVARQVVPELATWCVVDVLEADGTLQRLEVAESDPERTLLAREMQKRFPPKESELEPVMRVIQKGEPNLISEITEELLREAAQNEEHLAYLRRLELQTYMCVPMMVGGQARGAITFLSADPGRHYGQDDLELAQDLANRAGIAVENALLYQQVQEAVSMRDEFLASVSHDLKNPLAAIKGRAQILRRRAENLEGEDGEKILTGLENIDSTATRMTRLINDLMDVVRLRVGQPLELHRERTDLVQVVRDAIDEFQTGESSSIQFVSDSPSLVGQWDWARLERVVDNLLSNALKYSAGEKSVRIWLKHEESKGLPQAVLSVNDKGIGIPAADLPTIFERFKRGSNVSKNVPGSGIGLAGVKQIVEQHGGSIEVESQEGEGSTFTVRLPLTSAESRSVPATAKS